MRRHNYLFLIFCLTLTTALILFYAELRQYFSPEKYLTEEINNKNKQLEQSKLQMALLQYQLIDFKKEVAERLPAFDSKDKNFHLLTQATRLPASIEPIDMSKKILAEGKELFNKKNYTNSILVFKKLIELYPVSINTLEARSLLAESYFLNNRNKECLDIIDLMMTQYPDSIYTANLMLRMGEILESQNRYQEAFEVYETVRDNFSKDSKLKAAVDAKLSKSKSML